MQKGSGILRKCSSCRDPFSCFYSPLEEASLVDELFTLDEALSVVDDEFVVDALVEDGVLVPGNGIVEELF